MKNVELVELAATALGDLVSEVVFLGGASIGLWITDPGAPDPRPTADVDVIVEIATRHGYEEIAGRLRERDFSEDAESTIVCRFRLQGSDLRLDVMPTEGAVSASPTTGFPRLSRMPGGSFCREPASPSAPRRHRTCWRQSSRRSLTAATGTI